MAPRMSSISLGKRELSAWSWSPPPPSMASLTTTHSMRPILWSGLGFTEPRRSRLSGAVKRTEPKGCVFRSFVLSHLWDRSVSVSSLSSMTGPVKDTIFLFLGMAINRYQLLDVEDLCQAVYLCMTKPQEVVNDTFNIGAARFTTMREDYQAVLDRAGFGRRIVGIPARPAIAVLKLLEKLKLSPLYAWVYETAAKDSFVSIEKAQTKLGFKPKYSNKEALVRNYDWYLKHQDQFRGASGVTHRVPWKQGILALVKRFF
jgi:hypothetical protein